MSGRVVVSLLAAMGTEELYCFWRGVGAVMSIVVDFCTWSVAFVVKYTVLIEESSEGLAVSVPGLPGCHSQGETEAEALVNITDAIREYLDVVGQYRSGCGAYK